MNEKILICFVIHFVSQLVNYKLTLHFQETNKIKILKQKKTKKQKTYNDALFLFASPLHFPGKLEQIERNPIISHKTKLQLCTL